jgi:hypothetical protein
MFKQMAGLLPLMRTIVVLELRRSHFPANRSQVRYTSFFLIGLELSAYRPPMWNDRNSEVI